MKKPGLKLLLVVLLSLSSNWSFCQHNLLTTSELALMEAAWVGEVAIVQDLLDNEVNVDVQDHFKRTSLMFAVIAQQKDMVRLLIDNGANPNIADEQGMNALMYASLGEDYSLVDILLPLVEDVNHTDNQGMTALAYIAQTPEVSRAQQLILMGASHEIHNRRGASPLMYAAAFGQFFMVDFLIFAGADPNHRAHDGSAALHLAAWYGHEPVMGLLLDLGAELDAQDNKGTTPLMYAILAGNHAAAWYLIESGASLAHINDLQYTPLALAAGRNDTEMVRLLVSYNFLEPVVQKRDNSALARAIFSRNPEMVSLVRKFPGINLKGLYLSDLVLGTALEFNRNDLMGRIDLGVFESRYKIALELSVASRLFRKKVKRFQPDEITYLFMEDRKTISLKLQREILVYAWGKNRTGLLMGGGGVYSMADYRGTSLEPPAGFKLAPMCDMYYRYGNFSVHGSWLFLRTGKSEIPAHRFAVGVRYNVPLFSSRIFRFQPVIR